MADDFEQEIDPSLFEDDYDDHALDEEELDNWFEEDLEEEDEDEEE